MLAKLSKAACWRSSLALVIGATLGAHFGPYVFSADDSGGALQRQELERLWPQAEARLAENRMLSDKVASLEAELARLEALGGHLAAKYGLEGGEFDFSSKPGLGALDSETGLGELVSELQEDARARGLHLRLLKETLNDRLRKEQSLPSGWPVERGWVSSDFGPRLSPFSGQREMHKGIDIAGRKGVKIHAVASGVVRVSARRPHYGKVVEIDHGNGYRTRYGHNSVNLVKEGEVVRKGEVIALLGDTGRSTGSHLHFELIKNGRQTDPRRHLSRR